MPAIPTLLPLTVAVLAALVRAWALISSSPRVGRLADALLVIAGIVVLASVALPGPWTPQVLDAPAFRDPRLGGAIALAAASLLSVLALVSRPRTGVRIVSAAVPLAIGALAAPALVYFLGLHGDLPLSAVALGGATLGLALFVLLRLARDPGRISSALLTSGVALLSIGSALSLCGARATGEDAHDFQTGSVFSGPALIVREPRPANAARHPVVWLTRDEPVAVGDASLEFQKFRIDDRAGVHVYADIAVTRGGKSTTISPMVHASAQGEQPVPLAVEGVGSVLIAGMDADHGRVALLVPGAGEKSEARFTWARRPGLELAWAGLVMALVSVVPLLRRNGSLVPREA